MKILEQVYATSNLPLYLLLFLSLYLLQFTDLEFVTTDRVYEAYQEQRQFEEYGESYADEFQQEIDQMNYEDETTWDYILDLLLQGVIVLIETIKLPYIAFFMLICFEMFYGIKTATFGGLLKVTIIAEMIFLVQDIIQQGYLFLFKADRSMQDIIYSKPLALKSLLGPQVDTSGFLAYVVGYLDLFELGYIMLLAYGVCHLYSQPYRRVLGWTFIFYLSSQVIAVLIEVFFLEVLL